MLILSSIGKGGEGEARRDAALSLIRVRRADLIRECMVSAIRVAIARGEVFADDVRAVVPIPAGISPKLVGVVFRDLAEAGFIRHIGFRKSKRPIAHARPVSVWQLADAAGAAAWLAAHTVVPDATSDTAGGRP